MDLGNFGFLTNPMIILAVVIGLIFLAVILIIQFGSSTSKPKPPSIDDITVKHTIVENNVSSVSVSGFGIIDWGDGNIEKYSTINTMTLKHTYSGFIGTVYTIEIHKNKHKLENISTTNNTPPKSIKSNKLIQELKHTASEKTISSFLYIQGIGTIDWGDGTIESFDAPESTLLEHTYSGLVGTEYTMNIKGKIILLILGGNSSANINTTYVNSKAPNLEVLSVEFDQDLPATLLGLEKSTSLKELNVYNSEGFEVALNLQLSSFWCFNRSSSSDRSLISVKNIETCNIENIVFYNQVPSELFDTIESIKRINLDKFTALKYLEIVVDIFPSAVNKLIIPNDVLTKISIVSTPENFAYITDINGIEFMGLTPILETLNTVNFDNIAYVSNKNLDFSICELLETMSINIPETNLTYSLTYPNPDFSNNLVYSSLIINSINDTTAFSINNFNFNSNILESLVLSGNITFPSVETPPFIINFSNFIKLQTLIISGNTENDETNTYTYLEKTNVIFSGNTALNNVSFDSNNLLYENTEYISISSIGDQLTNDTNLNPKYLSLINNTSSADNGTDNSSYNSGNAPWNTLINDNQWTIEPLPSPPPL